MSMLALGTYLRGKYSPPQFNVDHPSALGVVLLTRSSTSPEMYWPLIIERWDAVWGDDFVPYTGGSRNRAVKLLLWQPRNLGMR